MSETVTPEDRIDERTQRFVEDMALFFEKSGHTRMAGRILAWLLVCDPAYQTAGQIAEALQASKASISTNVRMFTDFGMVERFTRPPDRRDYYRLASDAWPKELTAGLPALVTLRKLAEDAFDLPGMTDEARCRLTDLRDFLQFYEAGFAELIGRWQATQTPR